MSKILLSLLFVALCPILLFGQSLSLLYSYEIPTYSYESMLLNSQDFLDYSKTSYSDSDREDRLFNVNLGFEENYIKQSPKRTTKATGIVSLNYFSEKNTNRFGKTTDNQFVGLLVGTSNTDWYFKNERGVFFHSGLGLFDLYNFTDNLHVQLYTLPIGLGYGRIIGVRNVVQSYVISKELGAHLTDELLLKLAELIEKHDNGFYQAEFRDDSEIQFYKEIAEITRKPEQALKIQQIIDSPIYKTSERFVGWQVKLGINNIYAVGEVFGVFRADEYTADLFTSFEYALPLAFDKQIVASLNYTKNLQDGLSRNPVLGISARFSFDHNYTWASSLAASYTRAMPDEGDNLSNWQVSLKTDYLLLNSFSVFGLLSYENREFDHVDNFLSTPMAKRNITEFHLGFNYYLK